MAVTWKVKSEEVHRSRATWNGDKPRDGGKALLLEAFDWVRANRQAGRMTVDFGIGGSVSALEFEQRESIAPPFTES
jgi:hypothetical protein